MTPNWLAWLLRVFTPTPRPKPQPKPAPVPVPKPVPAPQPPPTPTALEVVEALNRERAGFGLGPLTLDPELTRIAQAWAEAMAKADTLSHGNFAARIASVMPHVPAAENVAEGYSSANAVVTGWMNSPGHRANILGTYNRVGVGVEPSRSWRIFWTVDFALISG